MRSLTAEQYERLTADAREAVDIDRALEVARATWVEQIRLGGNVLSLCRARATPKPSTPARRPWLTRALAIACGNGKNLPGDPPSGGTPAAGAAGGALLAMVA